MRALVLDRIGGLMVDDMPKPSPGPGEVLVKVKACGICGSDIPRAYRDGAHNMPLVIGHEFSGQVEALGEGVDFDWMGKRVGIFPLIPCKKCGPCQKKLYEMCKNYSYLGSRQNGGFAEYLVVPAWNLIALPENVSFEQAAMLEPMAVAVHAMRRVAPKQNETVAVYGLGTIGMLLTMFLLEAGIKNVLVIGNKEFQRENALKLGIKADNYCDSNMWVVEDWIKDKTEGAGIDVFFECIGKNEIVSKVIDQAAPSGRICMVGNPYSDMDLEKNVYWKILRNQLTVTGTWNSSFTWDDDDDWHYVIKCLTTGRIHPEDLISHKFDLEHIIDGFEIMRDKSEDYIKIIMKA